MKKLLCLFIILISVNNLFANKHSNKFENDIFIKYVINASYDDVIFSILDELSVSGFILSYRANIGKYLNKTSKVLKEKNIFINANKIGFCKNSLSLKMMSENVNNILFCPLSLAIYEIKKDKIIIIYNKAKILRKSNKIMIEVNKTIDKLIKKSLEDYL